MRRRAALGFRVHSGWAAAVTLAGDARSPEVIDRRRIEIADPAIPGSKQPYHAAEPLEFKAAEALLNRCIASTQSLAIQGVKRTVEDLRSRGSEAGGCAILLASGRPLPSLAKILASHALIHSAEGEMFREAMAKAIASCGLPVTRIRERDLFARASAALRLNEDELNARLPELGRKLGPPWRQDEKYAALAAWVALVESTPGKCLGRSAG